jgi:hypothetical protein
MIHHNKLWKLLKCIGTLGVKNENQWFVEVKILNGQYEEIKAKSLLQSILLILAKHN